MTTPAAQSLRRRRCRSGPIVGIVCALVLASCSTSESSEPPGLEISSVRLRTFNPGAPIDVQVSDSQRKSANSQTAQPDDAVIVGDSLTGDNAGYIDSLLKSNGLANVRLEGLGARRIAVSSEFFGYRDSGIERIRSLKAAGVHPELWVIQLGTNDVYSIAQCRCPDPVAFAGALIDRLRAAIGPATPTAWVTVMNRANYDVTNTFNEALRRRAAADPYFRVIDWAGLSLQRPEWFMDEVHQNLTGLRSFAEMYLRDITMLLGDLPGPLPPRAGTQTAVRIGAPLR